MLLFDEVELIARYSLAQRRRSYAELGRWLAPDPEDPACPSRTVATMTDDFESAVLSARNDREEVAPDVVGLERLAATRMRQYVRAWINEWDLVRLDPSYRPHTEVRPLHLGYAEQPDLESADLER